MEKPFEPGRWRPLFRADEGLFEQSFLEQAARFVREHPLLSVTTLNARFSGTQGFSIALTRSGFPRLEKSFPWFYRYLETVVPTRCNAFFINPLVIAEGSHVAPHIDRSLGSWCRPDVAPYPVKVSVLYLEVPDDLQGGRLLLHPPRLAFHKKPEIVPRTGLLFEFRGDLRHEVAEVTQARTPRISLVMEHYEMPPYLLRKIPEFFVRSKRPFESFMEEALGELSEPGQDETTLEPDEAMSSPEPDEAETTLESPPEGDVSYPAVS